MAKYQYGKRRNNPPTKVLGTKGFSLGVNQLTHPSVIKNNELAEALNTVYAQNGVLKKRKGSTIIGTARTGDVKVNGLQALYDIGDDDFVIRIGNTGIAQKFDQTTQTFSDIADSPTFSNTRTHILQGFGSAYFMNEDMIIAAWDGTEWLDYTALADPTTAPTLAKEGTTTGPRTYYYKYVFYNEIGYTMGSFAGTIANMPDLLDKDTYVKITIPVTPPTGTTTIGIFRGTTAGDEFFLNDMPVTQLEYHDKGELAEDRTYPIPEVNTTAGFKFKFATVFKNSLIGVTEELGDDTIVFSGAGGSGNFAKFGISRSEGDGGNESGFFAWRKGDGAKIVSVQPFKEQLYVFKTNKTGVFDFASSGAAIVKDVNLALGAVSQDSVHPAGNDLRGWGQDGAFSLGNEPNFADVIRTRLLSPRVQKTVDSISQSDRTKIVSVYHKNLSIWAIPTRSAGYGNNLLLVYDERYAAWAIWTGMSVACFTKFIDENNVEHLYYGDADSGNMVEMFSGYSDRGNPIVFRIVTKQFDAGIPYKYKTFGLVYLIFGLISGSETKISLIENGSKRKTYELKANAVYQGFGIDEWGSVEVGESSSTELAESETIVVKYVDMGSRDLFSVQSEVINTGLTDQIEFMGIFFEYSESEQPLPSSKKLKKISN